MSGRRFRSGHGSSWRPWHSAPQKFYNLQPPPATVTLPHDDKAALRAAEERRARRRERNRIAWARERIDQDIGRLVQLVNAEAAKEDSSCPLPMLFVEGVKSITAYAEKHGVDTEALAAAQTVAGEVAFRLKAKT